MERLCHTIPMVPGKEDEYVRLHREIWPEMADAMKRAGLSNLTLFRRGTDIIVVCDCDPDVATCLENLGRLDVATRWAAAMDGLIADLDDGSRDLVRFDEVWRLD